MKRIITIIALLAVFATNAQAQFVDPTPSQPTKQNTYSSSDLYAKGQRNIKTGNIVFVSIFGGSTVIGIVSAIVEHHPGSLWQGPLSGIG